MRGSRPTGRVAEARMAAPRAGGEKRRSSRSTTGDGRTTGMPAAAGSARRRPRAEGSRGSGTDVIRPLRKREMSSGRSRTEFTFTPGSRARGAVGIPDPPPPPEQDGSTGLNRPQRRRPRQQRRWCRWLECGPATPERDRALRPSGETSVLPPGPSGRGSDVLGRPRQTGQRCHHGCAASASAGRGFRTWRPAWRSGMTISTL